MGNTNSPSSEKKGHWIHAIGDKEDYLEAHDVLKPRETTADHLPKADNDKVRELDLEALQRSGRSLNGKWNIFLKPNEVDEVWESVVQLCS